MEGGVEASPKRFGEGSRGVTVRPLVDPFLDPQIDGAG